MDSMPGMPGGGAHMHAAVAAAGSESASKPGLGGSYKGHALAGATFIAWGLFVGYSVIVTYLASGSGGGGRGGPDGGRRSAGGSRRGGGGGRRAAPFQGRPWYALAAGPGRWFEPCYKLLMGLAATAVELRFSAACNVPERLRWAPCWPLYRADGHFNHDHLNNWQHASMYLLLVFSGAVDLVGSRVDLPQGTEQAALTLGFLSATLLMGLHNKHEPLDQIVHFLLTLAFSAATIITAAEALLPGSFALAAARPMLMVLIGTWFVQIGRILFMGNPAWSLGDHGGIHMAPVMFIVHTFCICAGFLGLYLLLLRARDLGESDLGDQNAGGARRALWRLLRSPWLRPAAPRARGASGWRAAPAVGGGGGGGGGGGAYEATGNDSGDERDWECTLEMGSLMAGQRRSPSDDCGGDCGNGGAHDARGARPLSVSPLGDAHARKLAKGAGH